MKMYKTITDFGLGNLIIEHFDTIEDAKHIFIQAIKNEAETIYLVKEIAQWRESEDNTNRILETYKKK